MKALLTVLVLLGAAQTAQAQSAAQICQIMADRGSYSYSNQCLQQSGGLYLDRSTYQVCETQALRGSYSYAIECIRNAARVGYQSSNAAAVCNTMAQRGSYSYSNQCLDAIAGGYFDARAVGICQVMADRGSYSYAESCLRTIRDRVAGAAIGSCETMASRGSYSYAIECLRTATYAGGYGQPPVYIPAPQVPPIVVTPMPEVPRGGVDHRGGQPSVQGDLCWVREQGRWMSGDDFFSYASQRANRMNRCVEARISRVANSGRIYRADGSRAAKERGGLSHSETDQVMRQYGLWGCEKLTCAEYN